MFQTGFPSIIRSSKLHIQRQIFVRPLMVLAASREVSSRYCTSNGLTNTWRCMCSLELLMMDGKPAWNIQSVLHKLIKKETSHLVGCTLRIYWNITHVTPCEVSSTSTLLFNTVVTNYVVFQVGGLVNEIRRVLVISYTQFTWQIVFSSL